VLALGSVTNFYHIPGLEERSLTMKSLGDAVYLRNRLIEHLEEADFEPALRHSNVTLKADAYVERLETSSSGREVNKVAIRNNGTGEEYSADIFVSSCCAINSAALLLRSANDKHPHGLANSSGVVGRHYMGHVNSVPMALSKCPNPTIFQKTLSTNDFYHGSEEWPYPMGHISFVGKLDGETLKGGAPALTPGWTLDLMARHSLDFWLTSEDLPDPDNRVTLDSNGGIVLSYKPNNEEGHKRLIAKLKELMKRQRKCKIHGHECHEGLFARNLYVGPTHSSGRGGAPGGNGPLRQRSRDQRSRCQLKAHDLDNLYVVDGGFFVSSGALNPALTIWPTRLESETIWSNG
jgi:choline dehydrogenase-like flavoprotein